MKFTDLLINGFDAHWGNSSAATKQTQLTTDIKKGK